MICLRLKIYGVKTITKDVHLQAIKYGPVTTASMWELLSKPLLLDKLLLIKRCVPASPKSSQIAPLAHVPHWGPTVSKDRGLSREK